MKALVAEIHKNYCILLTKDGRFIRKKMDGCSIELGDELEVYELSRQERNSKVLRITLLAASVVIALSLGAIFSMNYVRSFITPDAVTMAAAPEMIEEEMAPAASAEADLFYDEQERVMDLKDAPAASFAIQEGLFEYSIDDFNIRYEVSPAKEGSLSFGIENAGMSRFTGMIELVFLYEDGTISKSIVFEFEDFSFGQYRHEEISITEAEKSFDFNIHGFFD